MRSFLLKDKKPVCKWGSLPSNTQFIGKLPESYSLAVNPSGRYIVVDVDVSSRGNGFNHIPSHLLEELNSTLNYETKRKGRHYWFLYSGTKILANKTSKVHIDLRVGSKEGNEGGYVVWYPEERVETYLHLIKETSSELNKWLEELFSYIN